MEILTNLTKEINNYHKIVQSYDSKKTNTIRFLVENYNPTTDIIKKINDLHPDMQNSHDLWEMVDSTMYSEFMKVHKKSIKGIEELAKKCAYILEVMLVFCANQEEGQKFHIPNVQNNSSKEELLNGVQTIIKNVEENNDEYLEELITGSKEYQKKLQTNNLNQPLSPNQ